MSSLSFFLFSYHVHEKSILIPAVSALLTLKSPTLTIFTFLLTSAIRWIDGSIFFADIYVLLLNLSKNESIFEFLWKILFHASFWGGMILCFTSICFEPPDKYPHLFSLLISVYCCMFFTFIWLYLNVAFVFSNLQKFKVKTN
ncbi:putative dolichyl pyrophosphate Man9GlcNAc2 alpha-1,3-glucosyltransferase [Trichinella pseudospiralis]|uniref:Alpha-1,3-glucosyltransferase n=1 Tax=Trichinella pseudospiralis TaxID=6337 RepID=A0A0V1G0B6_TRIPS|nr:putative dolichyl pyrophosphate Man9GlcNAc2 alpha-1,3-glucosyltransferase [Trichinella pseudospiralis]